MTSIVTVIHQFFRKSPKMGNPSFPHDRKGGLRGRLSLFLLLVCVWVLFPVLSPLAVAASSQVMMKDGRILTGDAAPIESVAVSMAPRKKGENSPSQRIVVIDDQLRFTYVPKNLIMDIVPDDLAGSLELFKIHQPIFRGSTQSVTALGAFKAPEPFDTFGRRTIYFGGTPLVQGITEISPHYIRAQGINMGVDMRISPLNFKRELLTTLLKRQIDPTSLPDRLRIYLFYTQAELFEEAVAELEEIIKDFENDPENTEQLKTGLQMIRQLAATRLIEELRLRQTAGQHRKVRELLAAFNAEGVSFERSQAIQKMIQETDEVMARRDKIIEDLTAMASRLENEDQKKGVEPILEEIRRELNPNTLDRFSEFNLSMNDASLTEEQKLAVGLSGWLAGNAGVDQRLEIALSMFRLRHLIRKYLLDKTETGRNALWEEIRSEEAATPIDRVARIIARMKPPRSTPLENPTERGFYRIEVPSFEPGETFRYLVQLPPEYDPNRKYPTVVTLHSERTTPEMQIDWWSGSWKEKTDEEGNVYKERFGQGARFGYIVIAPQWGKEGEGYHSLPEESGAVLYSLRDALRRFSIDTDRIFLSGHSAGGDAVWDIGLAHPDLWAGLIPICGQAIRYPYYLRKNAEFVPVYAVHGELDGGRLAAGKAVLDNGMNRANPFDMTCVVFRGRGNESFSDEIIRIYEWMRLRTRSPFTNGKRTLFSMRPWDNFFWQVELGDFPDKTMILPMNWEGKLSGNYYPARTEFLSVAKNSIKVTSMADHARIFLSPDVVDFDQRIEVSFNGKKLTPTGGMVLPSLRLLLEDVRTRADRQHPFWAVFDSSAPGKVDEDWIIPVPDPENKSK